MPKTEIVFKVSGITKNFAGVHALKGVDFELKKGEVHALVGENGAGKSTLMNIILGIHQPTSGEMYFKGERFAPHNPADALKKGISMIHQEICLVPTTTISENIWIGREGLFSKHRGLINKKSQLEASKKILNELGVDIDPSTEVDKLSVAMMQLVEIARAVSCDSDVIIMDEPTSALTSSEVEKLYSIIRKMVTEGKSIIFISHKLEEVFSICDSVTVFRDGQFITSKKIEETTKEQLVNFMVGREMTEMFPKEKVEIGKPILEVKNFSHGKHFSDINFVVHKGEILGFCGLMGAGRTEVMQSIFGIDPKDSGLLFLDGKEINVSSPLDAIKNQLAMVTEDRLNKGIIGQISVKGNMSLAYIREITHYGVMDKNQEQIDCQNMSNALSIKTPSLESEIAVLSGGNQQKAIVGKWLLTKPEVFILDEPTRGIDVGAKAEIFRLIGLLAKQGKAVLFVSSELPELLGICDRILVMHEGKLVAEYMRDEFDQEKIMSSAFGIN
ncbi:MAG: sugar ABC transporter ATP-binding protein [Anaerolineaceae bacterium]